jgi:hypothetical protein
MMRSVSVIVVLVLTTIWCVEPSNPVQLRPSAAVAKTIKSSKRKNRFVPPVPPANLSAPGQRNSVGSRDPGDKVAEQVVAIVPEFEQVVDFLPIPQVWVLTATARPTFWFYVVRPDVATLNFQVEQLQRSAKAERYVVVFQRSIPTTKEGLVAVTLPDSFVGLQAGEMYRWSLRSAEPTQSRVQTSENDGLQGIVGWVQVKSLPSQLEQQIKAATPEQAVELYIQQGIWLDGLAELAKLYQTDPSAYQENWQSLLTEIELDTVIKNNP